MLRELAWQDVELNPPPDESTALMSNADWEKEVALAAAGEWAQLDLDELPDNWMNVTPEDLRNAT